MKFDTQIWNDHVWLNTSYDQDKESDSHFHTNHLL
jgi:hypothetical protein